MTNKGFLTVIYAITVVLTALLGIVFCYGQEAVLINIQCWVIIQEIVSRLYFLSNKQCKYRNQILALSDLLLCINPMFVVYILSSEMISGNRFDDDSLLWILCILILPTIISFYWISVFKEVAKNKR